MTNYIPHRADQILVSHHSDGTTTRVQVLDVLITTHGNFVIYKLLNPFTKLEPLSCNAETFFKLYSPEEPEPCPPVPNSANSSSTISSPAPRSSAIGRLLSYLRVRP